MFRTSRLFPRLAPRAALAAPLSQTLLRLQAPKLLPATKGIRFASNSSDDPPPPKWPIDREREKKVAQQKLKADPSKVSAESTAGSQFDFSPTAPTVPSGSPRDNPDIKSGLKHDIDIVKDTFRLSSVPRESYILGLAGTLPYLGTSLSTMFLAWNLNQEAWPTGNWLKDAVLVDHETAQHLLTVIEPVQLGYGAVIISFLGAIHWGLEYAEKAPHPERTRFRYGMGLAASIIAWPTLFLPLEYALTTQFMAFIALYFADSRAATRGWAPYWYGTYRFLLTAMVGIAIFVSLVGRSKIGQAGHLAEDSMTKSGIADTTTNWAKLEEEEKKRRKEKEKKEAEEQAKKEKEEEEKAKKDKKSGGKKKKGKDAKAASKDEDEDEDAEQSDDDAGDSDEDGDDDKESENKEKKNGEDDKSDDKDDGEKKGEEKTENKKGGDKKSKKNEGEEEEGKDDGDNEDKDEKSEKKDSKKKGKAKDSEKDGESQEGDEKEDDSQEDDDTKGDEEDKKQDKKEDKKSKKKDS